MAFFRQTTGSWASSDGGIGVAPGSACVASWLKCWKSKRDKAPVVELSLPALWEVVKAKDWQAAIRERWWKRTILFGSLKVPEHNTLTTAILSEHNSTHLVAHRWPHKWAATPTGNNSLYAIDKGCWKEDHSPTNHSVSQMAPYLSATAASDEKWNSGKEAHWGESRNLTANHSKNGKTLSTNRGLGGNRG